MAARKRNSGGGGSGGTSRVVQRSKSHKDPTSYNKKPTHKISTPGYPMGQLHKRGQTKKK